MYFYFIIALQGFCLYHLFRYRNSFYWVFVILFLPLLGSIIYLITQVYNRRSAEKIQDNLVSIINPTKKIKDLENRLQFTETYQNRVDLADALMDIKDYQNAITHYLKALEDNIQNDLYATKMLLECYFNIENYESVIKYAERIKENTEFKKSRSQFLYGLALEKTDRLEEAETHLRAIDVRYSFYEERFIFAKFLMERNKVEEAKAILDEIHHESHNMTKQNRSIYRNVISEVEKLRQSL